MAIETWQETCSRSFYTKITKICLDLIRNDRNHEKTDTEIIKNVIGTYCKK